MVSEWYYWRRNTSNSEIYELSPYQAAMEQTARWQTLAVKPSAPGGFLGLKEVTDIFNSTTTLVTMEKNTPYTRMSRKYSESA